MSVSGEGPGRGCDVEAGASLDLFGLSDVGRRRSLNEDCVCTFAPPEAVGVDGLLAVADGLGGHAAGEVASRMAIETLSKAFAAPGRLQGPPWRDISQRLREAILSANQRILEAATGDPRLAGMGTTLTACAILEDQLYLAHIGDSRAYLITQGKVVLLTQDHSWVGEQVRLERMAAEESRTHPRRHLITRALGIERGPVVDLSEQELAASAVLLLCSDGLHEMLSEQEIAEAVRSADSLRRAAEVLIALANERGGPDNITVALAQRRSEGKRSEAMSATGSRAT